MDREYLDVFADDMLEIAKNNWDSIILLNKLYDELQHRKTKASKRVKSEISKRLEELKSSNDSEKFTWPNTEAPASLCKFSGDQYWYQDGILSFVGYRVGRAHCIPDAERQHILNCVIFNTLPKVNSLEYMEEWGQPATSTRLKKTAESIATFTKNAKRNSIKNFSQAIIDWEKDLAFLKKYYDENLGFYWPSNNL